MAQNWKCQLGFCRLLLLLVVFVVSDAGAQDLSLSLSRVKDVFIVKIENNSDHPQKVNKSFSMDPIYGVISFDVRMANSVMPLASQINADLPSESSYVNIYPGQFIGDKFDLSILRMMYGMTRGCYAVYARYRDSSGSKFGAYYNELLSKPISICFSKGR